MISNNFIQLQQAQFKKITNFFNNAATALFFSLIIMFATYRLIGTTNSTLGDTHDIVEDIDADTSLILDEVVDLHSTVNDTQDLLIDIYNSISDIKAQQSAIALDLLTFTSDFIFTNNSMHNFYRDNIEQLKEISKQLPSIITKENFLKTLNEEVITIRFPTAHLTDFAALACEYDPLGLGPINCDEATQVNLRSSDVIFEGPEQ